MRSALYRFGLTAVSALALAPPAMAQAVPAAEAVPQEASVDDVVVTGSRIARDGFSAPTPTTVVSAEVLLERATVNLGDALNRIPSFRAGVTPAAGGIGNTGAFLVDLRGLGPARTLVLLEGGRLAQTNIPGQGNTPGATDLSVIPTALIRNIDVVTGGASAAYGSDAVAGVVNIILDDRMEGVRATVQYGQTEYGDAQNYFASVAGGRSFAEGRGHLIAGLEYNQDDGTSPYNDRDWGREAVGNNPFPVRPSGIAANVVAPNSSILFGNATSGGLIVTAGGLRGLAFVPGANGSVTTAVFTPGLYGNLGTSLDVFTDAALAANAAAGINHRNLQQLRPEIGRVNFLAKLTYDLTDNISAYIEPLVSRATADGVILVRRDGAGAGPALPIARDNVFLQQALTPAQYALVPANGISIGYIGSDFGPNVSHIVKDTVRLQTGLRGHFGETWKWDAAFTYASNVSDRTITNNFLSTNLRNAIDAISVGGVTVCRNVAARAAGCVPLNILGRANPSAEARAYVLGTASGTSESGLREVVANLQGEPFSTWAGPVSIGVGVEHRIESLKVTADPISLAGGFLTAGGSALPRVEQTVSEAYVETIVPLLRDVPLAQSLDFNGAVRVTDYSTSGQVTTWKAGLTWEPTSEITVRTTRSRDIRAPNLLELFTPVTPSLPLPADPRPGVPPITNGAGVTVGGNPNLLPEESTTQTFGVVYQPQFIQGLKLSADYYDIEISDAITSTSPQTVINNCLPGGVYNNGPYCSLITFAGNNFATGQITAVVGTTANVAAFKTTGVDIQANYRRDLGDFSDRLVGRVGLNLQATRTFEFRTSTDVSALFPNGINRAGQTGAQFGGTAGLPKWLVNTSVSYELDRLSVNAAARFIAESRQNKGLIGPDSDAYSPALVNSINNNMIAAVTYVDLGVRYNLGDENKREIFFNVDNVFDKQPPQPAFGTAYYDLLGRAFKAGIRVSF